MDAALATVENGCDANLLVAAEEHIFVQRALNARNPGGGIQLTDRSGGVSSAPSRSIALSHKRQGQGGICVLQRLVGRLGNSAATEFAIRSGSLELITSGRAAGPLARRTAGQIIAH